MPARDNNFTARGSAPPPPWPISPAHHRVVGQPGHPSIVNGEGPGKTVGKTAAAVLTVNKRPDGRTPATACPAIRPSVSARAAPPTPVVSPAADTPGIEVRWVADTATAAVPSTGRQPAPQGLGQLRLSRKSVTDGENECGGFNLGGIGNHVDTNTRIAQVACNLVEVIGLFGVGRDHETALVPVFESSGRFLARSRHSVSDRRARSSAVPGSCRRPTGSFAGAGATAGATPPFSSTVTLRPARAP